MRRISAKYAKVGMTLGKQVYDARGKLLFEEGTKLTDDALSTLNVYGVGEILLDDPRVYDVIVQPMIAPELEAQLSQALRQLVTETQASQTIEPILLEETKKPVFSVTRSLFPDVIGEPNAAGCMLLQDYNYIQPAKVVCMSLVMGKMLDYTMMNLAPLGLAALLMNIGYTKLPAGIIDKTGSLADEEFHEIKQHCYYGASMLNETGRLGPEVIKAVLQHHERWDGSGYPNGLKGKDISLFARIIAITDTFYALVSRRPHRSEMLPSDAVEFIMAFAGDLFDPELVQLFIRQVPIYPNGVTVKLNTKEVGIVSDANLGYIGRPKVRIIYNEKSEVVKSPYDIDLKENGQQNKVVVEVLGY